MDLRRTASEIGLFETGINLSRVAESADVRKKAGASMPLPDAGIAESVPRIAARLYSFGKKYMFLLPKVGLIEDFRKFADQADELVSIIPFLIIITILDLIL